MRGYWLDGGVARVALTLAIAMGCSTGPEFAPPREGEPLTLGELVYIILHDNLERAEMCAPEYTGTLQLDRERFVRTFDHTIEQDIVDELPDLLGGTILPLVDDGSLPELTDAVAEALAVLIDDELDPERTTLTSALEIAQTRTVLESSHAMELVRRILDDPTIDDRVHALAELAREPVNAEQDVVGAVLGLAARNLEDIDAESACGDLEVDGLADALLESEAYAHVPGYGTPAWVVRADTNGNPRVRPVGGALPAPFVDADGDLVADVDARGQPVDDAGAPIDLPAFGAGEGFDDEGRALRGGELVYEYVDVKQTTLGHVLQLGRDALEADVHRDVVALAETILGDPRACTPAEAGDDPVGCFTFPSEDNPTADAAFVLMELLRDGRAKSLVGTLAQLLQEEPALAEDLLVGLGDVIAAFEESELSITDRALIDTFIELLPLLDRTFEADAGGESTGHLLIDVVHELGGLERRHPVSTQIGWILDYRQLHKDDACSDDAPDFDRSVPVDYDLPRYYTMSGEQVDNRSGLEQVIELLDLANCGEVPFSGGRTVAYVALDIMADQDPEDVCNLVDTMLAIMDFGGSVSDFVLENGLDLIGCDGERVTPALRSLDALAKSGALDWLLPIARIFKERGQLDLLIEILTFVAEDLRLDEDGDPGTNSVVRSALPALSEVMSGDLPDTLWRLIDRMQSIEARDEVGGDGFLSDALVDAITALVETRTVQTRQGPVMDTSLGRELLLPVRDITDRLRTGRTRDEFDRVLDFVTGYLQRTTMDGGRRVLAHRNLVPLAAELLEVADRVLDQPPARYECWVGEAQDGVVGLLTGRDLAAVAQLVERLDRSRHGPPMEHWILEMLTPRPDRPERELYGPLLQVGGGLLGSDVSADRFGPILRWLGDVARQRAEDGGELLGSVDRLLQSDEDGAILQIGRNMMTPYDYTESDPALAETPIAHFGGIMDRVTDVAPIDAGPMCENDPDRAFTLEQAEDALSGVVEFLQDAETGMGAIWRLFGQRRGGPGLTSEE